MKIKKSIIKAELFLFFLLLPAVVLIPNAHGQDFEWVIVEGVASIENVTKEEAKRLAIKDAMRKAVEEVVGADILAETMINNCKVLGDVIKLVPCGKVIDKEIIKEDIERIQLDEKLAPILTYKVKMRIKVFKERGKSDPYFKVRAKLNRAVFKEGDEVEVHVTPTKDCYITIFNIIEDENVTRLIPNQFKKDNFVKANETFTFPDEEDKRRGIRLIAHVGEGKESVVETYYILGLKQPLKFDPDKFKEGVFEIYDGNSAFVKDLLKEVVEIPTSERAETFLQYKITM